MSERDEFAPAGEPIAAEVGERVTAVLSAAEAAASAIRHEAEEYAQAKRRSAESDAARYGESRRREADELLAQRLRRISELSDGLIERAESIVSQLDEAGELKRRMQALVDALGGAAEELAEEISAPDRPALSVVRDSAPAEREEAAPAAEPEPAEEAAPEREEPELSALDRLKAAAQRDTGPRREVERRGRFRQERKVEPADLAEDQLLGARLVALQMAVAGSDRQEVERHLRNAFHVEEPGSILDEVFGKADTKS